MQHARHEFGRRPPATGRVMLPLASLLLFVATATLAQRSYPIVCRGGGDLQFTYVAFSNFSPQPQIQVRFERARSGVGSRWERLATLGEGQCSWQDRAIAPDEPERLLIPLNESDFSISWSPNETARILGALPHVANLQFPERYQAFDVYNDRRGNFIVVRVGQFR